MSLPRYLIVNADDLGQSASVNRGIMIGHERGVVTSASLMVRWPHAAEAAALTRRSRLSIGLHLDLGEWTLRDGEWQPLYQVVALDDRAAVESEVSRQIDAFQALVGRNPTHLDSHQHVHMREPVREVVTEAARHLNIPVRSLGRVRYCGTFYGQTETGAALPEAITVDALIATLESLPDGATEVACHPADVVDLDTMYRLERPHELQVLCDPRIRACVDALGIQLISYADMP